MARLVRQPDLSPLVDVPLVLIIWWTLYGIYQWGPHVIYAQLDDGLVEPDRLRDTLTIVAGRAETILLRGPSGATIRGAGARAIGLSR